MSQFSRGLSNSVVYTITMVLLLFVLTSCGIAPEGTAKYSEQTDVVSALSVTTVKTNQLDINDNGKAIQAAPGDYIHLKLQAATSGGYEWVYGQAPDVDKLIMANTFFVPLYPGRDGSPSIENIIYQVLTTGETSLQLNHNQPWMTNKQAPLATFSVKVLIQAPSSDVIASYEVLSDWGSGATINVTLKNTSSVPINGWKAVWAFPGNQYVVNGWNASFCQDGSTVTASSASWNSSIPPNGGTCSFGFNICYSGANAKPSTFSLNGKPCVLMVQ